MNTEHLFYPQFFLLILLSSTGIPGSVLASEVIPDGASNTNVIAGENTLIQIEIAEANNDRTSYNSYTQFDVSSDGLEINNRDVAARTIINEVTGGSLSTLAGPIEVLGTRAHLIIANANGLIIDGASFVNTAETILTTGTLSSVERSLGLNLSQENIFIDTRGGKITIGPSGLAGAMTTLDLIAHELSIEGPVINNNTGRRNSVRLFPGQSLAELDSSLTPANPTRTLAIITQNHATDETILVDISSAGSITAGSISIAVTAEGAGVNVSGNLLTKTGDLQISANGDLNVEANMISAADMNLSSAKDIIFQGLTGKEQFTVSAARSMEIHAQQNVINRGVLLSANASPELSDDTFALNIVAGKDIILKTLNTEKLGIFFAASGQLKLEAQNSILNDNGRILGNSNIEIIAGNQFLNQLSYSDFPGRGVVNKRETRSKRKWYTLFTKRKRESTIEVDYGELLFENELPTIVANGNISISTNKFYNIGGDINANDGSITIHSSIFENRSIITGEVNFNTLCFIVCSKSGSSNARLNGGNIQASDNILITASTSAKNIGGSIFAINKLQIDTPKLEVEALSLTKVFQRPEGLTGFFGYTSAQLYRQDQGGSLIANGGNLVLNTNVELELKGAYLFAGGEVIIPAGFNIVRERVNESPTTGKQIDSTGENL